MLTPTSPMLMSEIAPTRTPPFPTMNKFRFYRAATVLWFSLPLRTGLLWAKLVGLVISAMRTLGEAATEGKNGRTLVDFRRDRIQSGLAEEDVGVNSSAMWDN